MLAWACTFLFAFTSAAGAWAATATPVHCGECAGDGDHDHKDDHKDEKKEEKKEEKKRKNNAFATVDPLGHIAKS